MKTRFSAIIASLLLFLAVSSCGRQKGMFVLQGTVHDGTDSILVVGLDNRFPYVDTISCRDGLFKWSFRPDTVTTLILILPDGRQYPVFAEKDVRSALRTGSYPKSHSSACPEAVSYTPHARPCAHIAVPTPCQDLRCLPRSLCRHAFGSPAHRP